MTTSGMPWPVKLFIAVLFSPLLACGCVAAFAWRALRGGFVRTCRYIDSRDWASAAGAPRPSGAPPPPP